MQEILDESRIRHWVESEGIARYFDTRDLPFRARLYEKGELMVSPDNSLTDILFVIRGVVQIYALSQDGRLSPVHLAACPALLGDVEFCHQTASPFFAEAKTQVLCLSLSIEENREKLDRDVLFLHTLLHSFSEKLNLFSSTDAIRSTLEERVVTYITNLAPNHEINGVEQATFQLHCDRRQLQRVLKKLCTQGTLQKIGKGRYKLLNPPEKHAPQAYE